MFGRRKGGTAVDDAAPEGSDQKASDDVDMTRPIRGVGIELDPSREVETDSVDTEADTSDGVLDGVERDEPAPPVISEEERRRRMQIARENDERPDPIKTTLLRSLRNAAQEFSRDQGTDLAAALTYYSVLSIFPAALALLSVIGVVSNPAKSIDVVLQVLNPLISADMSEQARTILTSMATTQAAGVTLVIGVLLALSSASGYVGAFGRAMNRILEVEEGRPIWKLRPTQILVTLVAVLLCAAALVILVVSGPVAESIGNVIGAGGTAVTVWGYAKWPVLALIVIAVVSMLYQFTPNVKRPFHWLSPGAFVAIVVWLVASVGFAFYVANFASYDKTFGAVAGAVVALLWLWLTNLALLFGAEFDSELERVRQLEAGLPAEEQLQLPLRDDRQIKKQEKKYAKTVAANRALRESHVGGGQVTDRPW